MQMYFALIEEENGRFGVTFPDLPGCVTEGNSFEEANRRAHEALALFASAHADEGMSIPAPRRFATLHADTEVRRALKAGATALGVSLAAPANMPRERVNVMLDKNLLTAVDNAVKAGNAVSRSAFVEEGLKLRLDMVGKNVPLGGGMFPPGFPASAKKNPFSIKMLARVTRSPAKESARILKRSKK